MKLSDVTAEEAEQLVAGALNSVLESVVLAAVKRGVASSDILAALMRITATTSWGLVVDDQHGPDGVKLLTSMFKDALLYFMPGGGKA